MPKKKNEELEQQIAELTADLQRVHADFVNYKRRADEDHARAAGIGKEAILKFLLPSLDSLTRAMENVPEDLTDHDYIKGVQSVAKQFDKALADMGVTRIEAAGQEFDPEKMEAVAMEDGEGDKEVVIEELQSGFMMGDVVVRPSMVKVGRE